MYVHWQTSEDTDFRERTWKEWLQILTQADELKKNRSLEIQGLEIEPCKLSFPRAPGKVFMHSQMSAHTDFKNVSLEYTKFTFIFPALLDIIDT